jgi:predicted GH43/DUF377 family glycosyl hydrolase
VQELQVARWDSVRFTPDPSRVIAKPFLPGEERYPDGNSRLQTVLERVAAMPEDQIATTLQVTLSAFAGRHRDLDGILDHHFGVVASRLPHLGLQHAVLSDDRRRLIAAYFTHEYSIEAAALGNPSMVASPDQTGLEPGDTRFVMSLRAIGEGHTSSIEFRSGVLTAGGGLTFDDPPEYAVTSRKAPHQHEKALFTAKLRDLEALNEIEEVVLAQLDDSFTMTELEAAIAQLDALGFEHLISRETAHLLHWLASSNYRTSFPTVSDVSERVLFPSGPTESHGMEDARFVRFVDEGGEVTYYATYTAYDGHQILPQLLETKDFVTFRVSTLTGRAAHNKGMALFPRKVHGRYVALGRHDNVNNYVMHSDDVREWREASLVQQPERPWELIQLGNCGSPLETEAGWLVITHGVGPFRTYSIGALLLDLDDPCRVIGNLDEPLLTANAAEREGYVPNVVYSCGSMLHGEWVVIPYGYADVGASVARVAVADLLTALTS